MFPSTSRLSALVPEKTEAADTECFSGMMVSGPDSQSSSHDMICEVDVKDEDGCEDDLDGSGENGGVGGSGNDEGGGKEGDSGKEGGGDKEGDGDELVKHPLTHSR